MYAYNWYDVGAVLPSIRSGLALSAAELGLLLGVFLAGVGLFQVPAGFFALRYGSRRASLAGLAGMGFACLGCAFAPDLAVLCALRFAAGVGAAFFFAPGLSLISRYYPAGERGPVIGLYNGAFSIGGSVGLIGGAVAGAALGWPFALGIGGALLLASALLVEVSIPAEPPSARPRGEAVELWRRGLGVLRSRSLWALSFGLTGFWAAVYVVAQYFVQFAHDVHPGWGTVLAAALPSAVVFVSFPGGPLGGWLGERARDPRRLLALFAGATGLIVLAVPFLGIGPLAVLLVALGLFDGMGFALLYLLPTYFRGVDGEGLALGIGFLNSVQVLGGSAIAVLFGLLIAPAGYTVAWVVTGLLALGLLPLLALVERTGSTGAGSRLDVVLEIGS